MHKNDDPVKDFFNRQSSHWSEMHYGKEGAMQSRITRFMTAMVHFSETDFATKKILDIGCGTGELARAFSNAGAEVYASDVSPDMMDKSITGDPDRTVNWVRLPENPETLGRIQIPISDEQFDFITLSSVLEYISDLPSSLQEIARLLKPKGYVFATVPNPNHPDRATEPFKIFAMQFGLVRAIINKIPRLASFELAYHSRNRMDLESWSVEYLSANLRMQDYMEPEETSLWLTVAQKID